MTEAICDFIEKHCGLVTRVVTEWLRVYEELIDKLVQELWRVLHFPAELIQLLLNSFCPTHVRDGNTYVQTHTIPNSSSDNSSSGSMTKAEAS